MKSIWKKFERFFTITGYARAASVLAQRGQYEEAKLVVDRMNKFLSEN